MQLGLTNTWIRIRIRPDTDWVTTLGTNQSTQPQPVTWPQQWPLSPPSGANIDLLTDKCFSFLKAWSGSLNPLVPGCDEDTHTLVLTDQCLSPSAGPSPQWPPVQPGLYTQWSVMAYVCSPMLHCTPIP